MPKYMTKKEVIIMFRETYKGCIPKGDAVARSEAWNCFTDSLRTDKKISQKAYDTWVSP